MTESVECGIITGSQNLFLGTCSFFKRRKKPLLIDTLVVGRTQNIGRLALEDLAPGGVEENSRQKVLAILDAVLMQKPAHHKCVECFDLVQKIKSAIVSKALVDLGNCTDSLLRKFDSRNYCCELDAKLHHAQLGSFNYCLQHAGSKILCSCFSAVENIDFLPKKKIECLKEMVTAVAMLRITFEALLDADPSQN